MKYEFLEHTADAFFKAYGKDLEEQFSNAAEAMFKIIAEPEKIEPKKKKEFSVEGTDMKSLLYNFLEEFLVLIDSEDFLLHKVQEIKIDKGNFKLECTAVGDSISEKYELHGDVKAVTYNSMEITDEYVQVVVDI